MSISHHSAEEEEATKRFVDQVMNRARQSFPDGPINRTDEGELSFAVAADPVNRVVIIHFGKPVVWAGMAKKQALQLADMLRERAMELP